MSMVCPWPIQAHLNSTGMGPVHDGVMHFITSPEDLVPVPAWPFWLGCGVLVLDAGVRTAGCLAAGGLFGLTASATNGNAVVAAAWFLVLGGLLAAEVKVSLLVTSIRAALLGLHHGYLN